ncbi:MAG: glycosyltransferase family 2 protein [Bacteroidales bacterium]|nr:glycosyltransferase family 2 protein [Bacteroidales bacterium]
MNLSVIIPLFNEEESLEELIDWITRVAKGQSIDYEIVLVDDGSNDNSWKVIERLTSSNAHLKAIRFRRNYGKAAALQSGFEAATGDVVITMDADMQDSPEEIPGLYKMITEDGLDMVSGWKRKRHDPLTKRWPSKFYNWTVRRVTRIRLHDFNCGLKAYKNDVVKSIEIYGDMHRYSPVLAKKAGFGRIGEKVVQHQKRKYGVTKYGLARYMKGYLDLLSIVFMSRFAKKPMHIFGALGTLMFFIGFFIAAYMGVEKIVATVNNIDKIRVTESPYFYLALTAMIMGTQLFLAGFLGEMISRSSSERNKYLIAEKINI